METITPFIGFSLLLASYCIGIDLENDSKCPYGHFSCNSSNVCVQQQFICDGTKHCPDGSDETKCEDARQKEFWNAIFKKRPDEDRHEKLNSGSCKLKDYSGKCKCSDTSIFCVNMNLKNFPRNLPVDVSDIDLSGNSLESINQNKSIRQMNNLVELILMNSEIKNLPSNAFQFAPSLKKLYLSSNQISRLEENTFSKLHHLQILDISHNEIDFIDHKTFSGLQQLYDLSLVKCQLRKLPDHVFDDIPNLKILKLDENYLEIFPTAIFKELKHLNLLSVTKNKLMRVESQWFNNINSLAHLFLSWNRITKLTESSFGNLTSLRVLKLNGNKIMKIEKETWTNLTSLESMDIKDNPFTKLEDEVFNDLKSLQYIYFKDFHMCAYALHVRVCLPKGDGISSIENLLDNIVLRISVWIVGVISCLGNLFVFISRIVFKEPNEVHSFFIKNLSIADLLMGIYLLIIARYDTAYRGEYIHHERDWRYSATCNWCGFISTVSSEASVIILTIITMDRYASITHPLTSKRRSMVCASSYMIITWIIAIMISAIPLTGLMYFNSEFYSTNGVCLPLQIHNPYGQGWEYSTSIFVGFNLIAFIINVMAYLSMFITIRKSKLTLRSTQQQQDRTIAKRFAFIVGTDFVCWMPIIITKILAHSGLKVSGDLYAWLAVFVLPVNAALNPILYTMTTKLFKQRLRKVFNTVGTNKRKPNMFTSQSSSRLAISRMSARRTEETTLTTPAGENEMSVIALLSMKPQKRKSSGMRDSSYN